MFLLLFVVTTAIVEGSLGGYAYFKPEIPSILRIGCYPLL
jgi:hypothetical protein